MQLEASILLAIAGSTAACATSRAAGTRPDDMTATEHLEQARAASLRAAEARPGAYGVGPHHAPRYWSHWYPWYYYWDPAMEYAALAEAHQAAAQELRVRFESACALVPRGLEGTSALALYTIDVEPVESGLVVRLAPEAGPPEVVLAGLRCHRAWLMLEPRADAGDEPLLLNDILAVAHAGRTGTDVIFTVTRRDLVAELQRRLELETNRRRR